MKYMVLETHPAYAVALDEAGRFIKTANLGYAVGDTVDEIVPVKLPATKNRSAAKALLGIAAAAACLCIAFFGAYVPNYTAHGTVRLTINPDVMLTVSQTDRVLGLEALNDDGAELIASYEYKGKSEDVVTAELVALAAEKGYLGDGGTVNVTLDSEDADWSGEEADEIVDEITATYTEQSVVIYINQRGDTDPVLVVRLDPVSGRSDFTYAEWQIIQSLPDVGSPDLSGGIGDGDAWEEWGENVGDSYEDWGEAIGD